jgi:hypothetical protein
MPNVYNSQSRTVRAVVRLIIRNIVHVIAVASIVEVVHDHREGEGVAEEGVVGWNRTEHIFRLARLV